MVCAICNISQGFSHLPSCTADLNYPCYITAPSNTRGNACYVCNAPFGLGHVPWCSFNDLQNELVTSTGLHPSNRETVTVQGHGAMKKHKQCRHVWRLYEGLNESFNYCVICDAKQSPKEGTTDGNTGSVSE